jgi:monovalent cation:H+ antiporter-2, CPA2 family
VIIEQVAHLAPHVPVIARARYHQYAAMLEQAGATATVDEEEMVGAEMARQLVRELKAAPAAAG